MKKLLLMLVLYFFTVQISFGQKKTSISGIIENARDTTTNIELVIFDGQFAKTEVQNIQLVTNNGKFKFDFELKRRARAGITINNRLVFLPGSFDVMVNPGDNFTITIPDVNKLGLGNITFNGKGVEKLNLLKAINQKRLATGIHRLSWDRTSITDKYVNADIYLNIIDSMCRVSKLKDPLDLQFIKAQQFDGSMDLILDHSVRNYSDSVAILFEKYIKKNGSLLF
ncbi:hypothetical protein DRF65_13820 [Chryseobacterium pennae]|uniref:DUF4369 domain-containing protein n=1 Tax=Chryseobacterium pennae TaxID=2258962 RepID=A0A3D9C8I5_9FLAO|nr:hypothetical protein [Chryseobacterium pennae]REC61811.1 hypothetical protein DRF65_13820 [Chryseobacterium pennae]